MLIKNLIYILQSGEYGAGRFLKFAYTHLNWFNLEKTRRLTWTKKSRAVFSSSLFLFLILIAGGFWFFEWWGLLITVLGLVLLPFIIIAALAALWPLDYYLKRRIIKKARAKIKQSKVTLIGITGSYGKTSTKEILFAVLKEKFNVLKTADSINTQVGIANFINAELDRQEVFIVEMGAYKPGEIKRICQMVEPDYSVLTGINEAHLEKFRTIENTVKAKFELPEATKKATVLNLDDKNIARSFKKFVLPEVIEVSQAEAEAAKALDDFAGIEFKWAGAVFQTRLLGLHNLTAILACAKLALELGLSIEEIQTGVRGVNYVPHRLEPHFIKDSRLWVLDDSYNANLDGVKSGLEVLQRARGRKIVLTPGPLVEVGQESFNLHRQIGRLYARAVDLLLLIKSKETDAVIAGLREADFAHYKQYPTTQAAHADLRNILKPGDTLLLQNDFPDVYF